MYTSCATSINRRTLGCIAVLVAAGAACGHSEPASTPDASGDGPVLHGPDAAVTQPSCNSDASDFIYFLATKGSSSQLTLYKFAPATLQLTELAPLSCPEVEGALSSVTVDRSGNLWLVHAYGAVYRAPIAGGPCTAISSVDLDAASGYAITSAAFAADAAGSDAETLYSISNTTTQEPTHFGRLSASLTALPMITLSPAQSPIALAAGWGRVPILTGTGDGRLVSLSLPDGNTGQTVLAQIDPTTGLQSGMQGSFASEFSGSNSAAFAFFGGDFWLFTHHQATANTSYFLQLVVTRYRTSTATASVVATFDDIRPFGAGVSTCAPVVLL